MAGAGAAKVAAVSSYAMSASVLIAFSSTMLGGGGGGEGFVLEEEGEAGGSCVATGTAKDGNLPGCGDPPSNLVASPAIRRHPPRSLRRRRRLTRC